MIGPVSIWTISTCLKCYHQQLSVQGFVQWHCTDQPSRIITRSKWVMLTLQMNYNLTITLIVGCLTRSCGGQFYLVIEVGVVHHLLLNVWLGEIQDQKGSTWEKTNSSWVLLSACHGSGLGPKFIYIWFLFSQVCIHCSFSSICLRLWFYSWAGLFVIFEGQLCSVDDICNGGMGRRVSFTSRWQVSSILQMPYLCQEMVPILQIQGQEWENWGWSKILK